MYADHRQHQHLQLHLSGPDEEDGEWRSVGDGRRAGAVAVTSPTSLIHCTSPLIAYFISSIVIVVVIVVVVVHLIKHDGSGDSALFQERSLFSLR